MLSLNDCLNAIINKIWVNLCYIVILERKTVAQLLFQHAYLMNKLYYKIGRR